MEKYNPRKVIINDVNASIINIYESIRDDVHAFVDIVDTYQAMYLPLSKEDRKKLFFSVRYEHAYHYQNWSHTHEAAVLYFLMKTGFNGIFQINKNTNGRFGTPSGLLNEKHRVYDKENVLAWSKLLTNAQLYATDWKCIDYVDNSDTFIFFDPPYRDSFTSYGQTFDDTHQQELLDKARSFTNTHIFLSNRDGNDGFFDNIVPLNKLKIPVTYTAGRRKQTTAGFKAKKATEILLYTGKETTINDT